MKVNLEKIEKNLVALEFEVEEAAFLEARNQAFKKVAPKITVPGFRKGKAPKAMIEKQVGEVYLNEEAIDVLLPKAYTEALDEAKIEPINKPSVEIVQFEKGKNLVFKATVEVKPEVQLGNYIGLEVERQETEVAEEDVNTELEKLRERHAQLVNVEDEPAQLKDTAIIDFEGFVDDVAFPGGTGTDYSLELGSGTFIPGFEDQLVGVKAGEAKDVNVTFPEEYHSTDLAGKAAVFKVTVKAIKRKELAQLDDEFAKDVSEFETLQELKNDIMNRLKEAAKEATDNKVKDQLVETVVEASEVEVPQIMVEQKVETMIQSFSQRLMMQGLKFEDYLKHTGTSLDEAKNEYRPAAEKAVKIDLVLEAIAQKENIESNESDIEEKVVEMAAKYNAEPAVFRQWMESGGNLEPLKRSIMIDKTVDFLVEKAAAK